MVQSLRLMHFASNLERDVASVVLGPLDRNASDFLAGPYDWKQELLVAESITKGSLQQNRKESEISVLTDSADHRTDRHTDAAPTAPGSKDQETVRIKNELTKLKNRVNYLKSEVKQRDENIAALTRKLEKSLSASKESTMAATKLVKHIEEADKQRTTEAHAIAEMRKHNEQLSNENERLAARVEALASELRQQQRKETSRLREHVVAHIAPQGSLPSRSKKAPTPTRKMDPSNTSPRKQIDDEVSDSALLVATIKQLRRKSRSLEMENKELRLKMDQEEAYRKAVGQLNFSTSKSPKSPKNTSVSLLSPTTAPPSKLSSYLEKECELLRQQVSFYSQEMERVQSDRDSLQRAVVAHPRSVEFTDGVTAIVRAIVNGCEGLVHRIHAAESIGNLTMERSETLQQQLQAVRGISDAVQEIAARKSSVAQAGSIPTVATAAECEMMTHFLTYEIERLAHLRAFLPSFAQVAMAVERRR
jgi:DNA repair exonuclease SbcCD ATPase subunit